MTFEEVLNEAVAMLKRQGRVSYGALKRQFDLDNGYFEDLKEAILYANSQLVTDDGQGLAWTGEPPESLQSGSPPPQPVPESLTSDDTESPAKASLPAMPTSEAERRQLTVMFCDLVGSTELSGRLDPEDLRDVVRAYQQASTEVIEHYDGYVAQHLGDGLMVYFGWPQAHEDDAQRSVHAGLGILEAMGAVNVHLEQEKGIRLAVRIGIHTGQVVIGEIGSGVSQEQLALGETPNVAARIQGLAEADTVVLSDATYRLVRGYFECDELSDQALRGVAEAVATYRVRQESGAHSRLESAPTLTPLVGREQEVGLLLERWEQAQSGQGQVVLISGEAGIGKSRLVQVLKDELADKSHTLWECRSSPYHQNTALYSITDLLQHLLGQNQANTSQVTFDKLKEWLHPFGTLSEEIVPLFVALLSIPVPPGTNPPLDLSPQQQRQKTLESLVALVLAQAEQCPLLVILEDLHWTDPSTLELLDLLIDQSPTTSMVLLLTCRPTFQPLWGLRTHLTPLALNRLARPQVERMIGRVVGDRDLPLEVIDHIVSQSDGVPLYIEEMTKTVLESDILREADDRYELTGAFASLSIPTTLQDSLMARLDRLVSAKGIAQMGATIGRQFSYHLLQAVSQLDAPTLQRELHRLVEAELLYQRGLPPQSIYTFKHALIQDVAYQSLLKRTRQHYHQRVTQVLCAEFPEVVENQPELLAHHYTEAELSEPAINAWRRAGEHANARSGYVEAETHLRKGLEILQRQSDSRERKRQELALQLALAESMAGKSGYTTRDLEAIYSRARTLAQQVGHTSDLLSVLQLMRRYYTLRGEPHSARELCEELLALAQRTQEPGQLQEAHWGLGQTLFVLGEAAASRQHLEQSAAFYIPQPLTSQASRDQTGTQIACLAWLGMLLWESGYPDQALTRCHEALHVARDLAHPYTLAFATYTAPVLYLFRHDLQEVEEHAEALIALGTEHDFSNWLFLGQFHQASVGAMRGEINRIGQMHHMLISGPDWLESNAFTYLHLLTVFAEACLVTRQAAVGLKMVEEAHKRIEKTGLRRFESYLYWSEGELLLTQATQADDGAEDCLLQALDIARGQQVKSWELRAATSLARLWQSRGKHQDAYGLLEPVYGWFTEGFDTVNLREAKALLSELEAER